MPPDPTHPSPAGLAGYMPEHRFRLLMLTCALALALMLVAVYANAGFGPTWARIGVPPA